MATLVKIGNSRGVRIPKYLIEQIGLADKKIAFEVQGKGLLIKPIEHPRAGWDEAFAKGKGKKDPGLLEDVLNHEADIDDWEW